jgi:hypothetical protein
VQRPFVLLVIGAGLALTLLLPLSLDSGGSTSSQGHAQIPSVLDLQLSDAAKKLQDAALCMGIHVDPAGKKFVVVEQSPPAGSFVHLRQRVMLTVGLGIPPSEVMPGSGYSLFVQGLALTPRCPKVFGNG